MKLRKVDPRKIRVPEVRVTARMDEDTARQFEESVKAVGIDEPIKCYDVEGELWLSDGLHRLQQALKLSLPLVDVSVREGTMEDVLCNNLMSGHLRGEHPVSEMVKSIELLWKKYGLDSDAIVKKTGLTREYVENLMLVSELTPLCRAALDDRRIKIGHAVALTSLRDPVAQETALNLCVQYSWKVADLKEYIKLLKEVSQVPAPAPVQTEPARPVMLRCEFCGGEYPPRQVTAPNICITCSATMHEAVALARAEVMKEAEGREAKEKSRNQGEPEAPPY